MNDDIIQLFIMIEYRRIVRYAIEMSLPMTYRDCYKQARSNARYELRRMFIYPDG